jgi:hypothetical protein
MKAKAKNLLESIDLKLDDEPHVENEKPKEI